MGVVAYLDDGDVIDLTPTFLSAVDNQLIERNHFHFAKISDGSGLIADRGFFNEKGEYKEIHHGYISLTPEEVEKVIAIEKDGSVLIRRNSNGDLRHAVIHPEGDEDLQDGYEDEIGY